MIEMTERTIVISGDDDNYEIITTECEVCFSLQPCLSNGVDSRCADWQACRMRQGENRQPDRPMLTPADQMALLDRIEIMTADMQRLKRIESAALVYAQAVDGFRAWRKGDTTPIIELLQNVDSASDALIEAVKR